MKKATDNPLTIEEIVKANPVIGILRNVDSQLLPYYVESILNGGIHAIEVAMNTPDGAEQIRSLKTRFGKDLLIGAGTAITPERIHTAFNAGASFFLTPSVTEENLTRLSECHIPVLPGVFSPSDVELCLRHGFYTMKLFPAAELPLSYIKSLKGPFSNTEYVAVGGVSIENLADLFHAGFIGAGVGSSLVPRKYIDNRDWAGAAKEVRRYCEIAANALGKNPY